MIWSKVGVTFGFCALLERMHQNAGVPAAADKKVAVGGHVERAPYGRIRNIEWTLPGDPTICGAFELHAAAATVNTVLLGTGIRALCRWSYRW